MLSLVASLGLSVYANSLQSKSYDDQLHLAASMPNEKEQVKAYFEAMKLNPQKVDAYEGLLNNCFLKDGNFSQDEVDKMTEFLGYRSKNGGDTIESQLKKNQEAYDQFAYDMGLAYFYYYGEEGNKQLSQPWFDIAKKSNSLTSAQIERAKRFSQIADYNMRINLKNKAGDNNISYKDYWNDIVLLASGDIVKDDNLKTGLVVYKELVSQILLHANDFKNAGIKKDEVESELEMVELRLVDIVKSKDFDEESDQPIIDEIEQNIAKAKQSIDFAYAD